VKQKKKMDRKEFIRKSGCSMLCVASAPILLANSSENKYGEKRNFNNEIPMKHKCKITVLRREFY
jgi:hypothetical protein